ncbi:filamentous hemagglutinin N-terminal domain-containing protein [Polynucleobacter sp. AP-Capit-er-40B-B4]|uniref:filamentous hemagglutinin N-terminal domain-containing protein n=1 Tax=Polynucleobacter sp. AP-Capit-er-40B-B4 TaxID=2576927 RepID=UPI001C0CD806|nr:filamentous hemagglutinin N-terminal domain-containing protein [Polynucleobacter sp. AP-Capit-er-40B-B4]MBU3582224.1 filamentous hemagglutinin N-terminal domain-containing protein [Polynucleobacter sp. AP-Capit-er-40B-B4]
MTTRSTHPSHRTQLKAAKLLAALAIAGLSHQGIAAAPAPNALPTGGQVVAGTATIATSGNTMNINQTSQRAVVNWNSFDVGSQAKVNFNQPNSAAATLNYVNSASKSMINGAVNANGQVIFVNNNGIVFGKGAEVNVGGMVATTMNTSVADFMAGKDIQVYEGGNTGKIINKGNITGNNINSYIALMAPQVKNSGVITATMSGNNAIALVSGQKVTLKFSGSQFVNVSVDASVVNSLISNKLLINAGSGQVIIAANAAQNLMGSIVRNTGTVSASDISTAGGKITLTADSIDQSGVIEANSAQNAGGKVSLRGNNIALASGSRTSATGATAGGDICIGVNYTNEQSVENITKAIQNNNLANEVTVASKAIIDTSAIQNGNGGTINIWSRTRTTVAGSLYARGGAQGGNGGSIETSSKGIVDIKQGLIVDTSSSNGRSGRWVIDPVELIIDGAAAASISNALNTTSVTLDATGSACTTSGCTQSQSPLIRILADIYSGNTATALNLVATNGQIDVDSNITAGSVYAVAQAININGSINTNGGSNSNIYLAGAIINILGNINSNGNSSNNSNNSSNTNSSTLNSVNTTTANNRRNGNSGNNQNTLNADGNTYTSNGGLINILATGDITINTNSYISANGQNGGAINIVSTAGKTTINGIVDSLGKSGNAGNIIIAGKVETNLTGALISTEGLSQGGALNLGQINNLGNGTILAPPATAPPAPQALLNFVQDLVSAVTINSNNSITSNTIIIDSQTGINAPNGNIVVFGDQIQINNSSITAANGMVVIGREGYSTGAISALTAISNSTLTGSRVETSGDLLGTESNIVKASEWLLDPTSVTITTTASSGTGATLASALALAGATNIKNTDIQAAINAGTSVNIITNGTITQSAALTFANSSGTAATLTLDNTSGSNQRILLSGGITATGTSAVNIIAKSAGGLIQSTKTSTLTTAAINVTGDVTFDNTYAVNGTTSGFITELNGQIYAGTIKPGYNANVVATDAQSGVRNSDSITAKNITLKGANGYANTTLGGFGVWVEGNLSATQDINVTGTQTFTPITSGYITGVYTNSLITINSTSGVVNITGKVRPTGVSGASANYMGTFFNNGASTRNMTITGNQINIAGYSSNSVVDTNTLYYGIQSLGTSYVINSGANYASGGTAVSFLGSAIPGTVGAGYALVLGTDAASPYSTNTGFGSVTNNASGGDIKLTSLNAPMYVAFNTISVAKNNTGVASSITYDSTSATNKGVIVNYGVVTVATGGSTAVNFVQKANGARIIDSGGAISVTGYVNIDNTNGSNATATIANANGVTITGAVTAGTLAGNTGVRINAIASGTGVGINDTAAITANIGPVSLTAKSDTASSINLTSTSTITSAGGISIIGSGSSSTGGTAGAVSVLGAISNTGANGVVISSTGNTATGNVSDSGSGGMSITGGLGVAAGTVTNGSITALGTLVNTGGGVIALSTSQPQSIAGTPSTSSDFVAATVGIDSSNASTTSNVSYGNIGGVMGSVDVATVNTVNYRNILSGGGPITITVGVYQQKYGTAYNGATATNWITNPTNVTVTSAGGGGAGFGVIVPSTSQVLASLRFSANLGVGGNSNLVQSLTDLSTTGAILSSYGAVTVTPVVNQNSYTITPKALTITAPGGISSYNGTSTYSALLGASVSVSGLVTSIGGVSTGDEVAGVTRALSSGGTTLSGSSIAQVGSYADVASLATGSGLSNYAITYLPGVVTVNPATLTITGGNRTTTYNANSQTNASYTVSGLLGTTDAVTANSVQGIATGTNAGTFNDSLSGATGSGLSNYTIVYVNGALTIGKANLTITSTTANSAYTGATQTGSFTTSGLLGLTDSVTGVSGVATGTNAGVYTSSLSGATGSGLSNYEITYINSGLNISKVNATLVGQVNTLTYNSSAQNNTGAVFTGLVGNDINTASATGYAVATHVAQGAIADNLSATGFNLSNYNLTITNGSLRITPAALSIVGAQSTFTYDATTKVNTYTTTGLQTNDVITVSGKASAKNVSTINDNLSIVFTTGSASDYVTTLTNGYLKITPAIITISGITANNKQYDATTAATLNAGNVSYSGVLPADTGAGIVVVNTSTLTGTFSDKNVADGKTVLISGISISGPGAGNYQLSGGTTATTTANITPAPLTITGTSVTTTYNGAAQSLAAPSVTGLIAGDNVVVSGTPSATNAGSYTASYSTAGVDAGNYTPTANAPVLTIQKAALVVTADNNGKIVTQTDPVLTAQLTGLQGSDTAASLGFTYSVGRAAGETAAGSPYAINATPTGVTSLANYAISYVPGVFTITPAGTVLIKMNPTTSTYGTVVPGSIESVSYVTSDGVSLRNLTLKTGTSNTYTDGIVGGGEITINPTTSATATTNVGTYVGAISNTNSDIVTSNGQFTAVQTIVNTAVINQANLIIAINPVTKTYDAAAFTAAGATAVPTGLMNGQTLSGLGGVTYSGTAIGAINASASTYSLLGSVGTGFSNYNVTVVPSTLTVNKAPLTITGGTATYTFDNTTRTNTYTVGASQLQGTDSVTSVTGLGAGLHVGAYTDGSPTAMSAVGSGLTNYAITYIPHGITITPAQLVAIATPTNSPMYSGGTAVPNTTVLSGVIGGTVVSGTTSLSLSGSAVGTETIINNGTALSGPNAGDYVVISSNLANTSTNQVTPNIVSTGNGGGSVVITPAPLTISGGTGSFVFDNTLRTNTYTKLGLLGNDTVTSVLGLVSQTHAGTYTDNLSGATGVGIGNYSITYNNGGIVISKAPLTALATPSAMTYSGLTNVPNTTALSGVIAGTTVTGATSLTLGSPNAGTQTITNNGTTLAGYNGGDYYVVSSNLVGTGAVAAGGNGVTPSIVATGNGGGTIPVAKAALSIVGAVTTSPYNGNTQTNTYTLSGVVNSEGITVAGSAQATHVSDGTVTDTLSAVASAGVLSNYNVTITNGSIAITPLAITGVAQVAGKPYDSTTTATGTIALNGLLPVDQGSTSATGTFTFNGPNAGTQTATVSGLAINNSDYTLSVPNLSSSATIAKAPLTITGDSTTGITFNNTSYTNGYTSTGTLFGTDTLTGVSGSATSTHAGIYVDALSNATGSGIANYDITYVNGSLVIDKAPLTALATPSAMTYSGLTNVPNTTALSGVIAGTTVTGATSLTLGSPNAGTQTITNNGTTLAGYNGGDYYVVSSNLVGTGAVAAGGNGVTPSIVATGNGGGTIPVAKALATVTAIGETVSANGAVQTQKYTQSGVAAGDNLGLSGLGSGSTLGIYKSSLSADNPNYIVTFVDAPFEITEAPAVNTQAPQELNNMVLIAHQQFTQTIVQSAETPAQPNHLIKGEMLYVRDNDNIGEYLHALPVPSSGSMKFPVPDQTTQELIEMTGEHVSVAGAPASFSGHKLLMLPNGSTLQASLEDGSSLPAGIRFNAANRTFAIPKISEVTLPITVKLTLARGNSVLSNKVMVVTK